MTAAILSLVLLIMPADFRPNLWQRLATIARNVTARSLGYHVVDAARNRRQIAAPNLKTEDQTLQKRAREALIETARDANRNFALAAWCVRKHLDFICTHHFHCRNADRVLRDDIEAFVGERMKAENFDARRRHPMDRWIRIMEARAVLDGDVFGIRLRDGTLQAVEGIYCQSPRRNLKGYSRDRWAQGAYLDEAGASTAFCFRTNKANTEHGDEVIPAAKLFQHGYFDRFDQARGIGLVTPGLATAVDLYETLDYAVAKAKVAQLFALSIYRTGETAPATLTTTRAAGDPTHTPESPQTQRQIDFGHGPVFLDLEPGERAEFLSTQSPGIDEHFLRTLCILTLSALDLPYCWLDASDANFFGNRGALILYLQSAKQKRNAILRIRDEWTDWQLERAFADGDLLRPREAVKYTWQAAGVPFWNPAQEVNAHLAAIDGVLNTRRRVVAETLGADWDDLLEEAEYEHTQLRERGLLKDRSGNPTEDLPATDDTDPNWQRNKK